MFRNIWIFLTIALISLLFVETQGQSLSYGFKAGLTNVSLDGPLDRGADGDKLESVKANRSFMLAVLINANFTDELMLQTEVMYNQKGYNYQYDGPSYAILRAEGQKYSFSGNRDMSVNISNTYIQIPVSLSYKLFNRLQVQGGVYGSLLVASTGAGKVEYSGIPEVSGTVEQTLNYNYRSNKATKASPRTSTINVRINNEEEKIAGQVGAYYDYEEKNKSLFNTFDAGAHVGVNFFLNQSLFVGVRYVHGLTDITRNTVDRSYQNLNNGHLIFSEDKDRYSAFEFSLGFSF